MSETWDSKIVAEKTLEIMPKMSRIMTVYMTSVTENEATFMQIATLHMLMNRGMTISDLAKKRHVSLQAASKFVQGLVERGWVVRVEDPNDRRRAILEVTEDGQEQESELRHQMINHLSDLMSDLSLEEISAAQIFLSGLNRLIQPYHLEENNND